MITKRRTPYLFLLPYLILFTVFIIIPTVMAIGLSFTNYRKRRPAGVPRLLLHLLHLRASPRSL